MSKSPIVQYVIIRKDLKSILKWSAGAIIAQACHATAAVIHLFHNDPHTVEYLNDLDSMHKIVLEVGNLLFWFSSFNNINVKNVVSIIYQNIYNMSKVN